MGTCGGGNRGDDHGPIRHRDATRRDPLPRPPHTPPTHPLPLAPTHTPPSRDPSTQAREPHVTHAAYARHPSHPPAPTHPHTHPHPPLPTPSFTHTTPNTPQPPLAPPHPSYAHTPTHHHVHTRTSVTHHSPESLRPCIESHTIPVDAPSTHPCANCAHTATRPPGDSCTRQRRHARTNTPIATITAGWLGRGVCAICAWMCGWVV